MSIDQLSAKAKKTLKRLATANNTTPEKIFKVMNQPLNREMVTRHPWRLGLS